MCRPRTPKTAVRECRKGKIYWRLNAKPFFETLKAINRVFVCNRPTWRFYLHFPIRSHLQTLLAMAQPSYFVGGGPALPGGGTLSYPALSSEIPSISTFLFLSAQYLPHPSLSPPSQLVKDLSLESPSDLPVSPFPS